MAGAEQSKRFDHAASSAAGAGSMSPLPMDFLVDPVSIDRSYRCFVAAFGSCCAATSGTGVRQKGASVTKADIVQAVYTKLGGFSKKESADLVDLVFETMKETLGRGEKIKISGFGNFVLRDKRQRQGRNPQTGDPIVITARRVLNFKASQLLKHALNDEDGDQASAGGDGVPAAGPPAARPTQPSPGAAAAGPTTEE